MRDLIYNVIKYCTQATNGKIECMGSNRN